MHLQSYLNQYLFFLKWKSTDSHYCKILYPLHWHRHRNHVNQNRQVLQPRIIFLKHWRKVKNKKSFVASHPSVWYAKHKTGNWKLSFCWTLKLTESQSHCYFQSCIFLTIPLVTFYSISAVSLFALHRSVICFLFSISFSLSALLFCFLIGLFYSSIVNHLLRDIFSCKSDISINVFHWLRAWNINIFDLWLILTLQV